MRTARRRFAPRVCHPSSSVLIFHVSQHLLECAGCLGARWAFTSQAVGKQYAGCAVTTRSCFRLAGLLPAANRDGSHAAPEPDAPVDASGIPAPRTVNAQVCFSFHCAACRVSFCIVCVCVCVCACVVWARTRGVVYALETMRLPGPQTCVASCLPVCPAIPHSPCGMAGLNSDRGHLIRFEAACPQ